METKISEDQAKKLSIEYDIPKEIIFKLSSTLNIDNVEDLSNALKKIKIFKIDLEDGKREIGDILHELAENVFNRLRNLERDNPEVVASMRIEQMARFHRDLGENVQSSIIEALSPETSKIIFHRQIIGITAKNIFDMVLKGGYSDDNDELEFNLHQFLDILTDFIEYIEKSPKLIMFMKSQITILDFIESTEIQLLIEDKRKQYIKEDMCSNCVSAVSFFAKTALLTMITENLFTIEKF